MRRFAILLLLSAAATPALADEPASPSVEAPRAEPRSERASRIRQVMPRFERRERAERVVPQAEPTARPSVDSTPPSREERLERRSERLERRSEGLQRRGERVGEGGERPTDGVSGWRWRERAAERARRNGEVPPVVVAPPAGELRGRGTSADERSAERRIGNVLRNRIATEAWRREWRDDRRFDWRRHRDWNYDRYRLGYYNDPFGWNYRRWHVGWDMPSRFLSSRYWINDPWAYRLPPAYGPYRWVRYWNDALLVDLRTGRVVDVIPQFFW